MKKLTVFDLDGTLAESKSALDAEMPGLLGKVLNALFPGGNDYPAEQAGVESIQVRDPNETKRVVETVIACLGKNEPTSVAPAKTS
ncbi:MAG TPA: hypothetical protein VIK01_28955 [Polyangiaceae bacterium]